MVLRRVVGLTDGFKVRVGSHHEPLLVCDGDGQVDR